MSSNRHIYSIVEYRGHKDGYSCGYCHSSVASKYSVGMWAHSLTVQDYQDLIDRGWRRSGKYVYKPTMDKTCCPQYVIRCVAGEYTPSKSHKKIIKRNNKFFTTDVRPKHSPEAMDEDGAVCGEPTVSEPRVPDIGSHTIQENLTTQGNGNLHSQGTADTESGTRGAEQSVVGDSGKKVRPGVGADPSRPPCKKAKQLRQERKLLKQAAGGVTRTAAGKTGGKTPKPENQTKTLEDYLNEINADGKHKLEIRLVRSSPRSPEFEASFKESYAVYKKYQMGVHKDPPDKPTESQYTRFLVDSPLEPVSRDNGVSGGLGSYHQQYLLDGRIIAVGVVDILPRCVSSVYLYYDPDYSFLTLGIYTALREMAFVRRLSAVEPSIKHYYMGFYIHSCVKMKYKGQFSPSFLLCPETYHWHPIEACRPKLDVHRYCRFSDQDKEDAQARVPLDEVLCLYSRQVMPYAVYRLMGRAGRTMDAEVAQYAGLVGADVARRMLLYRSGRGGDSDDSD